MKKDILLSIVAEWLEEWKAPSLIPRQHPSIELENLEHILAIAGPRRAGKTYFMFQLIEMLLKQKGYSKKDILFIDFEDYRLADFSADEVDELFLAFHQLAGQNPTFLFFDEIQHIPNWNRILRTLHNRRRFKIIISGSNSSLLSQEISTELRGRYDDVIMLPFSFSEFLAYKKIFFTRASLFTPARGTIAQAFEDYLKCGGFPEVAKATSDTNRRKLLQSCYKTIFYRDILGRYNIKARYVLDSLMNNVLESYSNVFSIGRFERHLKNFNLPGSKRTISNYLHYLEDVFFIVIYEKFSFSPRLRAMNPKKIYLTDVGFVTLGRQFAENRGRILENCVAVEMFRQGRETYYFKGRKECDFVLKEGNQPTQAIQVCWELNTRNEDREFGGLTEACRSLNLNSGLILTNAQQEEKEINRLKISVMPVWKWLLVSLR